MDQFKLKSIDELDLEFVSKIREAAPAPEKNIFDPEPQQTSAENVPEKPDFTPTEYFSKRTHSLDKNITYSPQPEIKPQPVAIADKTDTNYTPVGAPDYEKKPSAPFVPEIDYSETEEGEVRVKKNTGALVGKIISIILLAATVIVFILGCFVSIFLDNNGSNIGGLCFNTMSSDLEVVGVSPVSKGDLIISKKVQAGEYEIGDMVAVPSITTGGCDIHIINAINPNGFDDAELITNDITNQSPMSNSIYASGCYGVVNSYIPAVGGLLSFAIENAILVCILFVLLAAFWCLLLVLLEKNAKPAADKREKAPKAPKVKKAKKAKKEKKTEDEDDE